MKSVNEFKAIVQQQQQQNGINSAASSKHQVPLQSHSSMPSAGTPENKSQRPAKDVKLPSIKSPDHLDFFAFLEYVYEKNYQIRAGARRSSLPKPRADCLGLQVPDKKPDKDDNSSYNDDDSSRWGQYENTPSQGADDDENNSDADDDGACIVLIEGEEILDTHSCHTALRNLPGDRQARGRFVLTYYRIAFIDSNDGYASMFVPITLIKTFTVVDSSRLRLETKDYRSMELKLIHNKGPHFLKGIEMVVSNRSAKSLFAFSHKILPAPIRGWELARRDPLLEYRRLELLTSGKFRVFDNTRFEVCPSYPSHFVVPRSITDAHLRKVAQYRSLGRVPATVWMHPLTGATISRCAQPLTGIFGGRCPEDERMVAALRDGLTLRGRKRARIYTRDAKMSLVIFDARPWKAAMGNSVMGKGTENAENYTGCTLEFGRIDNIHAVRASLDALMALCARARKGEEDLSLSWLSELEGTRWLHYQSLLLTAANRMRSLVENGVCVLVHCSDGWDRTAQLVCLALILVDQHYRTIQGFIRMVECQWCAFGHKFAERSGHYSDPRFAKQQQAPIFLQFLEAVWQVLRQHPSAFEFNERFLSVMAYHVYSCRFGTFLFNTDRERQRYRVWTQTPSLWTYMLSRNNKKKYINPFYRVRREVGGGGGGGGSGGLLTRDHSASISRLAGSTNGHNHSQEGPGLSSAVAGGAPAAKTQQQQSPPKVSVRVHPHTDDDDAKATKPTALASAATTAAKTTTTTTTRTAKATATATASHPTLTPATTRSPNHAEASPTTPAPPARNNNHAGAAPPPPRRAPAAVDTTAAQPSSSSRSPSSKSPSHHARASTATGIRCYARGTDAAAAQKRRGHSPSGSEYKVPRNALSALGSDRSRMSDSRMSNYGSSRSNNHLVEGEGKASSLTINPDIHALAFWEAFHMRWLTQEHHRPTKGGPNASPTTVPNFADPSASAGPGPGSAGGFGGFNHARKQSSMSHASLSVLDPNWGGGLGGGGGGGGAGRDAGLARPKVGGMDGTGDNTMAYSAERATMEVGADAASLYSNLRRWAKSKGLDLTEFDTQISSASLNSRRAREGGEGSCAPTLHVGLAAAPASRGLSRSSFSRSTSQKGSFVAPQKPAVVPVVAKQKDPHSQGEGSMPTLSQPPAQPRRGSFQRAAKSASEASEAKVEKPPSQATPPTSPSLPPRTKRRPPPPPPKNPLEKGLASLAAPNSSR